MGDDEMTVVRGSLAAVGEDFSTGVLMLELNRGGATWSLSLAILNGASEKVLLDERTATALVDALSRLRGPEDAT